MSNGTVKKWRKILYEDDQGYPDNFTPTESFLAAIEKNKNLRLYSLEECLLGAAEVGKEVSSVFVFWSCYQFLLAHKVSPLTLLATMATGCVTLGITSRVMLLGHLVPCLRTGLLFSVIGFALSPVLYKLTDSISTDTIHSMAGAGLTLHLLTQDYGLSAPLVSSSISLNSAVFSAVCLASRFDSHLSAFCLLCLCVTVFLLLPQARPLLPPAPLTSVVHAVCALSMLRLSTPSSISLPCLALVLLTILQLLCPLLFYKLQSAKATIHGPWDEAVLR